MPTHGYIQSGGSGDVTVSFSECCVACRVMFADFNLNDNLLGVLEELGYQKPFNIQEKTLPASLAGKYVPNDVKLVIFQ